VQRRTCYPTRVVEATPGGRTNRMQRLRQDLVNQVAARPPVPLDLGHYPGDGRPGPTPHP